MGIVQINGVPLGQLKDRIARLSASGFRTELSQVLAAAALKQVSDGFRHSRDPYGNRWRDPKFRQGQPLRDTNAMSNSAAVEPRPNGFRLSITKHYAGVHQRGKTIKARRAPRLLFKTRDGQWHSATEVTIPRRQMVPEADTGGLGPIWGKAFNDEAGALIKRRLREAA